MPNPSFLSRRLRLSSHLLHFFISHSNITFLSLSAVHSISIRLNGFLSCRWGPHCVCYLSQQGGWKGRESLTEEGVVWHAGRETEAMIGEGGPERSWVNLPASPVAKLCVCVCGVNDTAANSTLLLFIPAAKAVTGGDRLAESLISALFPLLWDPFSPQTHFWSVTNRFVLMAFALWIIHSL